MKQKNIGNYFPYELLLLILFLISLNTPFTHGEIGVLMKKGQGDLLQLVNDVIYQMKQDGTLRLLHEKYGLVYAY